MATNGNGDRIRLSVSDKLQMLGMAMVIALPLAGVGAGMWMRLSVVESKVEDLRADVREIRWGPSTRDTKAAKQPGDVAS